MISEPAWYGLEVRCLILSATGAMGVTFTFHQCCGNPIIQPCEETVMAFERTQSQKAI